MKNWKPIFVENSRLPVWLSKISPIEIWAMSLAFWVFCRDKMSEQTRRHETIHYQQQLELGFILQWILYGLFWLVGLVRYRDGAMAYRQNPFEREAYDNEADPTYLETRTRWSWINYILDKS